MRSVRRSFRAPSEARSFRGTERPAGACGTMDLTHALTQPIPPMEARLVSELPGGPGWQFEPKWDGFRAIAVREGGKGCDLVEIRQAARPLFPGARRAARRYQRHALHPGWRDRRAARRHPVVRRAAGTTASRGEPDRAPPRETPAQLMLFDALALGKSELAEAPLEERRHALEAFHRRHGNESLRPRPAAATSSAHALGWRRPVVRSTASWRSGATCLISAGSEPWPR